MLSFEMVRPLKNAVICAVCFEGLSITAADGSFAKLAIIDANGKILDEGESVAQAVWNVSITTHKNYLIGNGHLKVHSQPTGIEAPVKARNKT